MEYLGNKLKILRKALQLTQKGMAAHFGLDQAVYQRYESNQRKTPHWLIKEVKHQFGINIDWMYGAEDEMWDSSHQEESNNQTKEKGNNYSLPTTWEELKKYDLTDRERRIMNEAIHFSEHLKSTSLPLEAKRLLLQIFLTHIDQAIQEHQQSDSQDHDPGEND